MKILKKIILTNNNQPILIQCDSRNDSSLTKVHQNCRTNYSNNNILKPNNLYMKKYGIRQQNNQKIPCSTNKINISLDKNNAKKEKENQTKIEYQVISYIDTENKNNINKNDKNNSSNIRYNYEFNKDFTINNNITNNISNHITNIILTNNNDINFKNKYLNKHKKINLDDKKVIFYNNNSNFLSQRKFNKKNDTKNNILNRNYKMIKNKKYSLTSFNNDIMKNQKNICLSNRNKILSEKLISEKNNKNKNILGGNKNNKLNKYFTSSSNININNNKNNKSINNTNQELKKNIKENKSIKLKNKNNNIEINGYINKLRNTTKILKQNSSINNITKNIKQNNSINNISKNCQKKFSPSLVYLEDTISQNITNIKDKMQIQNLKRIKHNKNYNNNYNYNCNSTREGNSNNFNNFKKNKNISFTRINNNIKNQYKSHININIDNIKDFNKIHSLINNKSSSKSFTDKNKNKNKNKNNSFNISSISKRRDLKININNINKTLIYNDSKSKSKSNPKNKSYNFNNLNFKKNIKLTINNNKSYKTERNLGNLSNNNKKINAYNNSLSKIINISNNKNKNNSFIVNYHKNVLNHNHNNMRKRISMNVNMNIHRNIKREFFTKSLLKKIDQSNFISNYKNNYYNSYKKQYLLSLANSFKNISYISQEKKNKNNKDLEKKKYYNNQKKIHEKKINDNKYNNRCKRDNLDISTINIHHNDLINLINIKYNKDKNKVKKNYREKLLNKEKYNSIFYNKGNSPENIIRKTKSIKKDNLSYEENKSKIYETKNIPKRKKYDSIPLHIIKNILNINSFNENFYQDNRINSARISPTFSSKNYLIKNYNNKNYKKSNFKKNNSFKISMHHLFNIPHYNNNNDISLNKTDNLKNNNIMIYNKNEKHKRNKKNKISNLRKNIINVNNSIFEKEILTPFDKNMKTFEVSDEEKEKDKPKHIKKEEKLFILDENIKNNPQYLGDYLIDILENLLLEESSYIQKKYINPDYLFNINNSELTPEIRLISINWIIMVHHKVFKFKENTLFLTVQLIDRFLSKKLLNLAKTELLLLCSLILASKHEEINYVNMNESLQLSSNKFSKKEIVDMEYEILNKLNFEIITPNMNEYYNIFAILLNLSDNEKIKGLYMLNIILVDFYMLEYPNFILALGVIQVVNNKSVTNIVEIIKDILIKNNDEMCLNKIKDEKIIDIVSDKIKLLYKKFISTKYKVIKEKFSEEKYNFVSNNELIL